MRGPMKGSRRVKFFSATTAGLLLMADESTASGQRNLRRRQTPRISLRRPRTPRKPRRSRAERLLKLERPNSLTWRVPSNQRLEWCLMDCATKKAISQRDRLSHHEMSLERLNVLSLPTLGALGHVELHRLALLQALEAARLARCTVHEN